MAGALWAPASLFKEEKGFPMNLLFDISLYTQSWMFTIPDVCALGKESLQPLVWNDEALSPSIPAMSGNSRQQRVNVSSLEERSAWIAH